MAATFVLFVLVALKILIRDHNQFFVASEAIHFPGILVLIYKLTIQKTCSEPFFEDSRTYGDFCWLEIML
ncbi:hypothetical protein OROHE_026888 [Orobanche hederae]